MHLNLINEIVWKLFNLNRVQYILSSLIDIRGELMSIWVCFDSDFDSDRFRFSQSEKIIIFYIGELNKLLFVMYNFDETSNCHYKLSRPAGSFPWNFQKSVKIFWQFENLKKELEKLSASQKKTSPIQIIFYFRICDLEFSFKKSAIWYV